MDDFLNIKKKYNTLRENERKKIIDSLASKIDKDGNHLFTKKTEQSIVKKIFIAEVVGNIIILLIES